MKIVQDLDHISSPDPNPKSLLEAQAELFASLDASFDDSWLDRLEESKYRPKPDFEGRAGCC